MKIISWNMANRPKCWRVVAEMDADVALLQEACASPSTLPPQINIDHERPWKTGAGRRNWRTAVVGLSRDVKLERVPTKPLAEAGDGDLGVSLAGTISVAHVEHPRIGERVTLISMYAAWQYPHPDAGGRWNLSDAAAHRLISDMSSLVGSKLGHRIIAAGDLNCLYGYGDGGDEYWACRYQTIFDRFEAIGLAFVGPQFPGGRQASPWPSELPPTSKNVPTRHTPREGPAGATRQLDFVFASHGLAPQIQVRALNELDAWGPSDHCRVEIVVG